MNVSSNLKPVADAVRAVASNQVPFATSRAINATAKDVQTAEADNLKGKFTLRTDWWKPGRRTGVNVKFSNKQNLTATVSSRADWLGRHEQGGVKTPKGKSVAVPTLVARGSTTGVLTRERRPRAQLSAGAYIQTFASGAKAIFQNLARGVRRVLFWLHPRTRIQPALRFKETGEQTVTARYPQHFRKAYADALRSFKPKS